MYMQEPIFRLDNFILSLSDALDLVHPTVKDHQQRVAYLALRLAKIMQKDRMDHASLMYGACLHDIGILSLESKLSSMAFEVRNPQVHCELGHDLVSSWSEFSEAAEIIRWHHHSWTSEGDYQHLDPDLRLLSNIVHLADSVDRFVDKDTNILSQSEGITEKILSLADEKFAPEAVLAFKEFAKVEAFWLDMFSPRIYSLLRELIIWPQINLRVSELEQLSMIFSRVVDLRSRFTATHSIGVATTAAHLAQIVGMSEREVAKMRVAGYLHDLGKVAVPNSILEKNGKLDPDELDIMRGHTYFTYQILNTIDGFEEISGWAAFHHEKLDGSGYPFHCNAFELPLGARIMAVADVFTAISEDRPYRKGMLSEKRIEILNRMVASKALDEKLVAALIDNFSAVDQQRADQQYIYTEEYEKRYSKYLVSEGVNA